jgi:hypothetical protein
MREVVMAIRRGFDSDAPWPERGWRRKSALPPEKRSKLPRQFFIVVASEEIICFLFAL